MLVKSLYKYKSISGDSFKYTQDIFLNKRIYLPPALQLNDPTEGLFTLELEDKNNSWTGYANQYYIDATKRLGVFSLSETNNNILMWAHYADNHTGICIEFNVSQQSSVFHDIQKITYSDKLPHIKRNQNENEVLRQGLLNKTSDWSYEAEWRLISKANKFYPINNEITTVIVGARISNDNLNWVKYWIKDNPQVSLKKCIFSKTEYKVNIADL